MSTRPSTHTFSIDEPDFTITAVLRGEFAPGHQLSPAEALDRLAAIIADARRRLPADAKPDQDRARLN